MTNFLTDSSAANSLNGVADILAAGFLRLLARKSSLNSPAEAKTPLDCKAKSRGHVRKKKEDVTP